MRKKIIIGLIGDHPLREKVCKIFQDIGFYKTSVSKKTAELAKYLLPGDEFPEETLQEIRNRGYSVNKCYWINLVLASVPDSKELIIIDDLQENDKIDGVITSFYVSDQPQVNCHNFINANSLDLESEIHSKIKRISVR